MGARDAAQRLYDYVTAELRAGRAAGLGDKTHANATVRAMQTLMRSIVADGIYGPKTRARGKELLGREFPPREGKAPPPPPPPPKDKDKPEHKREPEQKREPEHKPESRRYTLRKGARYRATLRLDGMARAATNDQVAAKIASDADAGPWSHLSVKGEGADRVATGIYMGATREVKIPREVVRFDQLPDEPPRDDKREPERKREPEHKPAQPAKRAAETAARELWAHASKLLAEGHGAQLGTKGAPSAFVKAAQLDMGLAGADGIYGPATRAKGKQLTGLFFPART